MTFLAPLLLLAAVTLAVPFLLHLFRKKSGAVRTFPALRYLKQTTREHARIVRLRQFLLLFVRLAVLALLVLAAARLILPVRGGDHPPAGIVVIVDNGVGSARVVDDRRVLDHLVGRALEAIAAAGEADRIWVLPAGEPWRPALPLDRAGARRVLGDMEPTGVRPDLPAAVARAHTLLEAGAPPLREILVLSDLEEAAFSEAAGPRPAGDIRVVVGTLEVEIPPNRGFAEVSVGGGLPPRAGAPTELDARIEGEAVGDQAVRVHLDGRLAATGRTDSAGRILLSLPPSPEGWLTGQVEIDPDALRFDDVYHISLPVRPPPVVRAPEGLPRYLATALAVLGDLERISTGEEVDGPPPPRPAIGIEAAGRRLPGIRPTLVFPPGDPALLPAVNQRLAELGAGWRMEVVAGESEALVVEEAVEEIRLPAGLEVHRRYRLVRQAETAGGARPARVLARLSDGTPWVVHLARDPDGEFPGFLLVGSSPDPDASRLPTSASMVPFLTAALEILDGGTPARALRTGDPLPLPSAAFHVRTPRGTRIPVDGTPSFLETGEPGVYEVLDRDGGTLARVAANSAPPVQGTRRLPAHEAAARFGPRAVGVSDRRGWTSEVLRERRGREVWRPLLIGALLLLILEGWLATRTGDRARSDERAGRAPAIVPGGVRGEG